MQVLWMYPSDFLSLFYIFNLVNVQAFDCQSKYTQRQRKVTSKSRKLITGQYLIHFEQRTADTIAFNFMAYSVMNHHYGKRFPTYPNALFPFLDGCQ